MNNVATSSVLQVSADKLVLVLAYDGGLGLIFFSTSSRNMDTDDLLRFKTKMNEIFYYDGFS